MAVNATITAADIIAFRTKIKSLFDKRANSIAGGLNSYSPAAFTTAPAAGVVAKANDYATKTINLYLHYVNDYPRAGASSGSIESSASGLAF